MDLLDFEQEIEPVIVARGRDYYESGYVLSLVAMGNGEYTAQVEGTEVYTVAVKLDDQDTILETTCTCPYDFGLFCKHQVAVFLAICELKFGSDTAKVQSDEPDTFGEVDVRPMLAKRKKGELIDFICYLAAADEEVAHKVELAFIVKDDQDEVRKARALIRMSIKQASTGGFVDYRHTWEATRGAYDVLEMAEAALDVGMRVQAVRLALCVVGEMMDLLQSADDSDGNIGDKIAMGLDICRAVTSHQRLTATERDTVLGLILTEAMHARYEGWSDQQLDLFECALMAVDTPEQRAVFL
ncbi:MAG: hypothetical protein EOM08_05180, partial [Clostridia bacterium]|nr:hypothetical protein [Clostridia bacterium]